MEDEPSFSVENLVEATGFEPAASASRTQRSTKLSHASTYILNLLKAKEKHLSSRCYSAYSCGARRLDTAVSHLSTAAPFRTSLSLTQ